MQFSTVGYTINPSQELINYWNALSMASAISRKLGYSIAASRLDDIAASSYIQWKDLADKEAKSKTKTSVLGFGVAYGVSTAFDPRNRSLSSAIVANNNNRNLLEENLDQVLRQLKISRNELNIPQFRNVQRFQAIEEKLSWISAFAEAEKQETKTQLKRIEHNFVEGQPVVIEGLENRFISENENLKWQAQEIKHEKKLQEFLERNKNEISRMCVFTLSSNGMPIDEFIRPSDLWRIYRTQKGTLRPQGPIAEIWHQQVLSMEKAYVGEIMKAIFPQVKGKQFYIHLQYVTDLVGQERTIVHLLDHIWTMQTDPELA